MEGSGRSPRWKSNLRKSKARADGSEWAVLTLERGLALECLVALAGLRGGSLHSAWGHRGQKVSQLVRSAQAKVQKKNEPNGAGARLGTRALNVRSEVCQLARPRPGLDLIHRLDLVKNISSWALPTLSESLPVRIPVTQH
uniref:Uncharacterized protein n=1 Tax=Molossus molossus TaxID=27622 RepID=A0A7J8EDX9_MOLMO|nr:hypothetical protein HJG59_008794 [Molossus molossus]